MSPERTAYDEKLESILRTAADVFSEKGYHQASIRDIARATGISLSGLYYYFQSKEELLFLIQDHALCTLLGNLERLLQGVDDPVQRLRLLVENHLRFFASNMAEMKVLSHEAGSLSGDFRGRVNDQKRRLTGIGEDILRQLQPDGTLDLRVSVYSLFGMMNWIYNWYRPERDVPVEVLAENMLRIFLGGYLQQGAALPAFPPSLWEARSAES